MVDIFSDVVTCSEMWIFVCEAISDIKSYLNKKMSSSPLSTRDVNRQLSRPDAPVKKTNNKFIRQAVLQKSFECPCCTDYMYIPMIMCVNGHTVCMKCVVSIMVNDIYEPKVKCPICRSEDKPFLASNHEIHINTTFIDGIISKAKKRNKATRKYRKKKADTNVSEIRADNHYDNLIKEAVCLVRDEFELARDIQRGIKEFTLLMAFEQYCDWKKNIAKNTELYQNYLKEMTRDFKYEQLRDFAKEIHQVMTVRELSFDDAKSLVMRFLYLRKELLTMPPMWVKYLGTPSSTSGSENSDSDDEFIPLEE